MLTARKQELYNSLTILMNAIASSKSTMDLEAKRENTELGITFTFQFSVSDRCRQQILAGKTMEELEKWAQQQMRRKRKRIELPTSEERHKE